MENYSIMPLQADHVDEICEDIKKQYETGVSTCALFCFKLVPEGVPAIDKARQQGELYKRFRDRLAEMGLDCGILVQCTIGHGYPLNQQNAFQDFIPLDGSDPYGTTCPYDKEFQAYMTEQFKTLAALRPRVIMVDDDFRLMNRGAQGCACPLHLAALEERVGRRVEREELYEILCDKTREEHNALKDAYVDTIKESLLESARAMRAGIDAVDPTLKGIFCLCGMSTEFASDIAAILAGEGNPPTVRFNNGNYTPAGPRKASGVSYSAAQQIALLDDRVKILLAETDTCPQNRYSTGAYSLHTHFTLSILEGASGAKHWITRLMDYEPQSGLAYRRVLSKHRGFYETLSALVPSLRFDGCRIPLYRTPQYTFASSLNKEAWSRCVLERLGLPLYFSAKDGGAAFLDDEHEIGFSDEEISRMLKGTLFLSARAAQSLEKRGFASLTGVKAENWEGEPISGEIIHLGIDRKTAKQKNCLKLTPLPGAETLSTVYHLRNGKEIVPLFPGCVYFENAEGGKCITFAGTPNTAFKYTEAFSFLTQSRKAQFVKILARTGNLPIYCPGDEEIYLKYATDNEDNAYAFLFNIGTDPIDSITLCCNLPVHTVRALLPDGTWQEVAFHRVNDVLVIEHEAITLMPVVLQLT